jgi:HMG (high mobility group) box
MFPDMPRRPLSAYNLFFRQERENMLRKGFPLSVTAHSGDQKPMARTESVGNDDQKVPGIGFANLARTVAAKWKGLPAEEKAPFEMEAAREKARYDAQMLGWRASQEQKKARASEGNQQIIDALTSGPVLQAYAAHLGTTQHSYPEHWFQLDSSSQTNSGDSALHFLGTREQQQRELLAHQQLEQLEQLRQLQQLEHLQQLQQEQSHSSTFNMFTGIHKARGGYIEDVPIQHTTLHNLEAPLIRNELYGAEEKDTKMPSIKTSMPRPPNDSQRQVRFVPANPSTSFELRAEEYVAPPMLFEQKPMAVGPTGVQPPAGLQRRQLIEGIPGEHQPPRPQFGDESAFTAGLIQQTYWASSAGHQPDRHFGEEPFRVPRVEHRSSIGTPYQAYNRTFWDHPSRVVRSQSYPSATPTSLSPRQHPNEESWVRLNLDTRGSGQATPLTPMLSPHSNTHSILNTPNMFPTPPQENDVLAMSPRGGFEVSRPLIEPPPAFPAEEEFQSIDFRYFDQRHSTFQPRASQHVTGGNLMNDIRLSDEIVTEPTDNTTRQQNLSLFRNNDNTLGSRLDNDGVDFLANLKFEE